MTAIVKWIRRHDSNFVALRRAARTAIVMPSVFALCVEVIGNLQVATYAAFGSMALLMLVDFAGPTRSRLQAHVTLSFAGAVLICLGTLVSQTLWLSILAMGIVAVVVLFEGVVSAVLASASTALLLVFILSTAVAGPASSIPDRLAGWGLASVASFFAVWLLWPVRNQDPLRESASKVCRTLAARLRMNFVDASDTSVNVLTDAQLMSDVNDATTALHQRFLAAQWRPTGLSVASRATVRLVDELLWLDTLVSAFPRARVPSLLPRRANLICTASADVLEASADILERPSTSPESLANAQRRLRGEIDAMMHDATLRASITKRVGSSDAPERVTALDDRATEEQVVEFVASLEPGFRAQELGYMVSLVGANADVAAAADRRGWLDTLVGNQPRGSPGPLASARERARTHLDWRSVWMHNSVRGAVALTVAVFVAEKTGVQHAFWVILGALSVLRSNALNTGQNALRSVWGTTIGFVCGAVILVLVGANTTLLWFLLPLALLVAGFAPSAISFAAGQAGFTITLVILYNILQPVGWRIGLYRVEDIAIGCAVSVGVGLVFWPRGAAKELGATLGQTYEAVGDYLVAAVGFGTDRCDRVARAPRSPDDERLRAAAAARRLDDALRTYLGERGSKPLPQAEVAALVRGVASLRQTADAIVELWSDDAGQSDGQRVNARAELAHEVTEVRQWYGELGAILTGKESISVPVDESLSSRRLLDAVRDDLRSADGDAVATAVRLVWTKDYLDAARRLGFALVDPARGARGLVPTSSTRS
ncbi:MAG TPA: FUSC family protein [Acidimicrobiales bacterium]